jgi:hypothetical protein
MYIYLFREGGEGGKRTREKVRWATVHKYPTKLKLSPVLNSDKHLPQSPFSGPFF